MFFTFLFSYMTGLVPLQVKGGVAGLYDGAEVVLGPDSGLMEPGPEQQFINQKMRPGSGVLSVQVLPDGPTRVLQVRTKPSTAQIINHFSTLTFTLYDS